MKHLSIVLTFFFLNIANSQNSTVTYNFKILEDPKMLKNPLIGKMFAENIKAAKLLEFKLVFNDTISKFESIQSLGLGDKNTAGALIASRCKKPKFNHNNTLYYNNSEGVFSEDKYLIISPSNKNWVLTDETKKIDNYTCYKATTEYVVVNSRGTFKHPVIAWFCPELPYSFGPAGYDGLPGLILELQEWNNVFGAIKIEFKSSDEPILLPIKGEKISYENYQNKVDESFMKEFDRN